MTLTYQDDVAIFQIVVFVFILPLGVVACTRHGFSRSAGWLLLVTFSIIRLVGSICELVGSKNHSTGAITTYVICTSIGLSPLTLLNLAMLSRLNRFVKRPFSTRIFRLLSIVSMVGIALGITGGVKSSNSATSTTSTYHVQTLSKVAVVLFIVVYVGAVLIFFFLRTQRHELNNSRERYILSCFAICIPFITVRLVYALIGGFGKDAKFGALHRNMTIYLCMAVLEEIIVAIICGVTAILLPILPKASVHHEHVEEGEGTPLRKLQLRRER